MVSPHMGRHYYASIVTLAENVPIDVISKMLGHTNIRKRYRKVGKITLKCDYLLNIRTFCVLFQRKFIILYQEQ